MQTSLVSTASVACTSAELIVLNGNTQGIRRPLRAPLTILGQGKGCDIRLNGPGVKAVHCMIAIGSEGPYLRSFAPENTLVNDESTDARPLRHGDRLAIGSCCFEVYCPPPTAIVRADTDPQRERLLIRLQSQLSESRARYRQERNRLEAERAEEVRALARVRDEIEREGSEATLERERLLDLRRRFLKRWKKHWTIERGKLQKETQESNRERSRFHRECAAFEFHKSRFEKRRDEELAEIRMGWEELAAEKAQQNRELGQRTREAERRGQELEVWTRRLAAEQHRLDSTRQQVEQRCARLRIEAEGLESRVLNSRAVLVHLEQQRELLRGTQRENTNDSQQAKRETVVASATVEPSSHPAMAPLVETLADQRLILLEQLEKLANARELWRDEQTELAAEMATLAEKLHQHEADLQQRRQSLQRDEDRQRESAEQTKRLREEWEARQSRHAVREMAARAEHHRAEAEMTAQSEWLARREKTIEERYRHWRERRRKELVGLRLEHSRCRELRQRWTASLLEQERAQAELANQRRGIAEQAVVLEREKQACSGKALNPRVAEKQRERLGRRAHSALAKMERILIEQREQLSAERTRLEAFFATALSSVDEVHSREAVISDQLIEWESQQVLLQQRLDAHAGQQAAWRQQQAIYREEIRALQAEIDRLTEYLMQRQHAFIPLARAA